MIGCSGSELLGRKIALADDPHRLCSAEGLPACQPLNGCVCFTFQCTVPVMPTHHHQPLAGGLMCEQTSVESKYKIL